MALRDVLVKMQEGESADDYLDRAIEAAKTEARTKFPRLRIEAADNLLADEGSGVRSGASLWVERGFGQSESWQRVTVSIFGASYEEVLSFFGRALERNATR